jgi:hypothetical protein
MHEGRGRNHQAYLWQYSRPGGTVVFDFRLGRGRDGPKQFLGQSEGLLQTDGYAAYDQIGGPKMVHAGCSGNVVVATHSSQEGITTTGTRGQSKPASHYLLTIDLVDGLIGMRKHSRREA